MPIFESFGPIFILNNFVLCVQEVVTPIYIMSYYIKWVNYFLDIWYIFLSYFFYPRSSGVNSYAIFRGVVPIFFLFNGFVSGF